MSRPSFSTQLRSPSPQDTDEGRGLYIARLERRLIFYILRDLKARTALELATGVPYDELDLSKLSYEDIYELIVQDMARGLNISIEESRERVESNKVLSNPDII